MKRLLFPLLAALAFPTVGLAGIPQTQEEKWATIKWKDQEWLVDTEDVEVKGTKIRFYVQRRATPEENQAENRGWRGKARIDCKNFKRRGETFSGSIYLAQRWEKITPAEFAYELANQFCFLTGVDGYTAEVSPPPWANKIIQMVNSKPIRKTPSGSNFNCDSQVWRNKPECMDY